MKIEPLRIAIQQRMKDNWTFTNLDRIIFGDNRKKLSVEDGSWCRLYFNITTTENAAIGTDFQRAKGVITLQIFTSLESGEKSPNEIADAFSEIFQNKQFNGVTCYTVTPVRIGQQGESYQTNAKVDFEYDVFN